MRQLTIYDIRLTRFLIILILFLILILKKNETQIFQRRDQGLGEAIGGRLE